MCEPFDGLNAGSNVSPHLRSLLPQPGKRDGDEARVSTHAVGVDVIETSSVCAEVLGKHPERFLRRVYTPAERGFLPGTGA
jgi:hypothetical protein